ncbi:MAG: PASTA domain-containing protein [Clostridia bacterium]|nr:PASTA domain-containing protein [Clostridia bacterium]
MKKTISLILVFAALLCLFSSCGGGLKVPEVFNTPSLEASALVADIGLVPKIVEEYSHAVEIGNVIRTEPEIGAGVKAGAQVTIFVSKGISPTEDVVGYFIQTIKEMIKLRNDEWDGHTIKWEGVTEYTFFDIDSDGVEELILGEPKTQPESWAGKEYYIDHLHFYRFNKSNSKIEFITEEYTDRDGLAYSEKLDALICPSHSMGRIYAIKINPYVRLIDAKCPGYFVGSIQDLYYVDFSVDNKFNVEFTQAQLDEYIGKTVPIEFKQISELLSEEAS